MRTSRVVPTASQVACASTRTGGRNTPPGGTKSCQAAPDCFRSPLSASKQAGEASLDGLTGPQKCTNPIAPRKRKHRGGFSSVIHVSRRSQVKSATRRDLMRKSIEGGALTRPTLPSALVPAAATTSHHETSRRDDGTSIGAPKTATALESNPPGACRRWLRA